MFNRIFKIRNTSIKELKNELSKAIFVSNQLYKINGIKEERIKLLENEIKDLKLKLSLEEEYNILLNSGYESQRQMNSNLNSKLNDIRLTEAFCAKYN